MRIDDVSSTTVRAALPSPRDPIDASARVGAVLQHRFRARSFGRMCRAMPSTSSAGLDSRDRLLTRSDKLDG